MPHLLDLIGEEPLKKQHPLDRLSENDIQIINDAIGIMRQKMKMNGKGEKELRGRVSDTDSFVGLLSELFWCHRLTRYEYSFNVESKTGGADFKVKLDQRTVCAEVKTLQKGYGSKQKNELNSRLMQTIEKQINSCPWTFLIFVMIKRKFSDKTIKPLAAEIRRSLQEMSPAEKENTFEYPTDTYGYNREAKVTIIRADGEKPNIFVASRASWENDKKLLRGLLETARKQFNPNDVNVVFVDKTSRHTLDDEDIKHTLSQFYRNSDRISAVVVYQRNGMAGIQDANIYPHPQSCKLTETEKKVLDGLLNC